jgi:hypothetical protein
MSFVTTSPVNDAQEPPIANGDFWPEIDPAQIRDAQRIDSTITPERLRAALIEAMASANVELAAWAALQVAAGHATLAAVPAIEIDDESIHVHRYRRAVGCLAKANLIERYRDYDTTARGDRKADALENPIDDLRRDARWAISDILGVGRTTVELI